MPASQLSVGEAFVEPLGFHDPAPTFSWLLPEGVKRQTAYRIETRAGDKVWDSGWVEGEQSTFVPYGGPPFVSRDRAEWRVRFRDEQGTESEWSALARFELGLLSSEDWRARWVRPSSEMEPRTEPVANLRRTFLVTQPVVRARLYATARGLFSLQINGRRVGSDHFANGFTSYDKRIDTLTYDVTEHLRRGENTLEGLLGCGWYAGRFPFETQNCGPYGRDIALLAQLEITYANGSTAIVATDEKWEDSFDGPIVSSSLYDGEVYDARRRPMRWAPVIAEPALGAAVLTPKAHSPVRAMRTLGVQRITEPLPGRFVFDLGQNMVGWARIRLPVAKDKTITLRYAEMLQADGTLYTANYRTAKSTDTYTAAETGIVEWEPHFTFHGFRYVELTGLPPGARPQPDWLTGVVLYSDLRQIGRFESSHAKLNQLQSNIVWGWRGNAVDIPTDCPQRDERMGWTGDAQVFCATSMFNTDAHAFWKSWLRSMRDNQYADGAVPPYIPTAKSKWEMHSPGWMDAAAIIPWDLYVRTGDIGVLAENYAMMERLVGWYRLQTAGGQMAKIRGLGDWLQPYPKARATAKDRDGDRRGDTPLPLLGAAFYARDAGILAGAARALGRHDDARRYAAEAARARAIFAEDFFDAAGKVRNGPETQTAYVLAIAFDLIPPELKRQAGAHLARLVAEAGGHLRTGFLGTPFIAHALDQTGHADVAASLLFRETHPSWFFSINQGATTNWERWNSFTLEGGFGDVSMNSFNHYAYGAIGQWMYERVAGLAPDSAHPGYKHFFVRPLIVEQLESASAQLDTPYGKATSAWRKSGKTVEIDVVVPPNATATIELPDKRPSQVLEAGAHRFVSQFPESSRKPTVPAREIPIERTKRVLISQAGAVGDGATVNTSSIQTLIDQLSASGGGTIVVPPGVFISGALDFKPGVNLYLEKGGILRATTDMAHFPQRRTRIEGQFSVFTPALINADGCDGLRIAGEGTLDGDGRKIWDEFWTRMKADPRTRNQDVARARIALITNSRNVLVEGVAFKDSQFWNLHLYRCRDVVVRNVRLTVPDDYGQAPSTDGIDVDSSQDVLIEGCYFSVTDDCVAMKGTKGPFALEDKDSPPVERVRIINCTFRRGHAAVTLGSEATVVRDVVLANSRVTGPMFLIHVKLRPDTPQHYENVHVRDISLDGAGGQVIRLFPWNQYVDLEGQPPPRSIVRNIVLSNIAGRYGAFGCIEGNRDRTAIGDILFKDIVLTLVNDQLRAGDVKNLQLENVIINGIVR